MARKLKKAQTEMVWRFVRYNQRFGTGDETTGPPQYLAYPINAWTGPRGEVQQGMNMLRRGKNFTAVLGAMYELLAWASNTDKKYRGYLLDKDYNAAQDEVIAGWLNTTARSVAPLLKRLEAAALIEAVPLPDFQADSGQKPATTFASKCASSHQNARVRTKKQKRGKKNRTGAIENGVSDTSLLRGRVSISEKKKQKGKTEAKTESQQPLTEAEFEERRQLLKLQVESQAETKRKGGPQVANTTAKGTNALAPTTTPPITTTPTNPDAGERWAEPRPGAPPASLTGDMGRILKMNSFRYTPAAWAFADEVLHTLKYPHGSTPDHAAQRANFAKAFDKLAAEGFDGSLLENLRKAFIRRMGPVGSNRASKQNPEAYARKSLDNLASTMRKRMAANQSRAGPA